MAQYAVEIKKEDFLMKTGLACLLVLSLLLSCFVGAMAETTVTTVNLNHLYYPYLNQNVNMIYSRTSRNSGYSIFDLTGNSVTFTTYDDISSNRFGFRVQNAAGQRGFIDASGKLLVPTKYADIDAYSTKWQVGIVLFRSTSENYDYSSTNYSTGDKTFYLIDHADVYFCGQKVGTLKRNQYTDNCEAHGDYLYIRDRDGKYHYYNSSFQESGYDSSSGSSEYDSVYKNHKYTYYHKGSGQKAFASGCTLTPDEVSRSIVENNGVLLDLQGNTIA